MLNCTLSILQTRHYRRDTVAPVMQNREEKRKARLCLVFEPPAW